MASYRTQRSSWRKSLYTNDDISAQALEWVELDQSRDEMRIPQKHIQIADRSDWGVVAEYEVVKLADDSYDKK